MISESLRRTILGIVAAVLSALMFAGVLTPEEVDEANTGVASAIDNAGGLLAALAALWGIFTNGGKE